MTVQIEDDVAQRLRTKAEARGLSLESYLANLAYEEPTAALENVEEPMPAPPERREGDWPHIGWTHERWEAWNRWRDDFNARVNMGPIPEGATS